MTTILNFLHTVLKKFAIYAVLLAVYFATTACTTSRPATHNIVSGNPFQHSTFVRERNTTVESVYVFISGDGRPWITPSKIAADPTPKRDVALELFYQVDSNAIFLGRPCYYHVQDNYCAPSLWTNARYSRAVVDSMIVAARKVLSPFEQKKVVLVGYSGGGTLAALMANALEVDLLVTISANLDVQRWVDYHNFPSMSESLNPADIKIEVPQMHFTGGKDINTPVWINRAFYARNHVSPEVVQGNSHSCCWSKVMDKIESHIKKNADQ